MRSIRFLFLACLFFSLDIRAQETPDRPILQRVSVDPLNERGLVTIDWTVENPQISPIQVDEFRLFWFEPQPTPTNPNAGTNHFFATIPNPGARKYEFLYDTLTVRTPMMPDPRKTTVAYTLAAVHREPYSSSLLAYVDYCVQVSNKYDSCRAEIMLKWHPYKGWQANTPPNEPLVNYRVMRFYGGGIPDEEIKGDLSDLDTFYVVRPVEENSEYTFYIEAIRRDRMVATSYLTTKATTMPRPPSSIEAVGTQYNSDGLAEISFKIDPLSQTHNYELLGSSKPDYAFVSLGTFDIHGDTVLTDIRIRNGTYYYKLEAWHVCKNKYTTPTNMATALWLSLKQDDQVNYLKWDSYQDWGNDPQYEVHRQVGNNPDEIITTITDPSATEYWDDLSGVLIDGDVCYWVTAAPVSSTSSGQYAISNMYCIQPESDIFIPQAFTPDRIATENHEYKIFFSYPPQEFMLYIYDRTGANVFQTNYVGSDGISAGWDGRLKSGKPANEGVYVYYLKFRTAKGRLVEKRGTIVLIRP